MTDPSRPTRVLWLVAAFAAVLLLVDLGALAQFSRAEIYFAEVAREMRVTGDWITPRYCEEIFFDKPPLVYWLIAASFEVFGRTEAAARLPSALGALATVGLTAAFAIRYYGARAGLIAGLALPTALGFWSFARYAMSDALLTLFVAAALFAFRRGTEREEARWRRFVVAGHLALSLGLLTKGPVTLVLAGLGMGGAVWFLRSAPWRRLFYGPALAAYVLVTLPWYVAALAEHGRFFVDYFLVGENVQRFLGETYSKPRPWGFYLGVILGQFFPWSLWLVPSVWILLGRDQDEERRQTTLWLVSWVVTTAVFFSLSRFQLDYYLLPTYPAMAILVGAGFSRFIADRERMQIVRALLVVLTAWALGGVGVFVWLSARAVFPEMSLPARASIPAVSLGGAIAVLSTLAGRRFKYLPYVLAGTVATLFLLLNQVLVRPYDAYQPVPRFGRWIASRKWERPVHLGAAFDLASWHADLRFYTGLPARPLESAPELMRFLDREGTVLLVASERHIEALSRDRTHEIRVWDRGPYWGHALPRLDAFRREAEPRTILLVQVVSRATNARGP